MPIRRLQSELFERWIKAVCFFIIGFGIYNFLANKYYNVSLLSLIFVASVITLIFKPNFLFPPKSHLKNFFRFPINTLCFISGYLAATVYYHLCWKGLLELFFTPIPLKYVFPVLLLAYVMICFIKILLIKDDSAKNDKKIEGKNKEKQKILREALLESNDEKADEKLLHRIRAWANEQEPLKNSENDLFGFIGCAENIAQHVENNVMEKKSEVIGLLGSLGSGKSSIIEWVDNNISKNKIEIIKVSCWKFSQTEAVESYILRRIVQVVSKYVNIAELSNLPENWRNIIDDMPDTYFRLFFKRIVNPASLDDSLNELEEALEFAEVCLLLIIEDGDRRTPTSYDNSTLQLLIEQLKQIKGITILIAIDPLWNDQKGINFDVNRLCDKNFSMPAIPVPEIEKIINLLVYTLIQQSNQSKEIIKNFPFLWSNKHGVETTLNYVSSREFIIIASSPRKLKSFIRRLCDGWENVSGKVDFFDFFLVTFISEYFPNIRNFLIAHMGLLSLLNVEDSSPIKSVAKRELSDIWEEAYSKSPLVEQLIGRKCVALLLGKKVFKELDTEFGQISDSFRDEGDLRVIGEGSEIRWKMALEGRIIEK